MSFYFVFFLEWNTYKHLSIHQCAYKFKLEISEAKKNNSVKQLFVQLCSRDWLILPCMKITPVRHAFHFLHQISKVWRSQLSIQAENCGTQIEIETLKVVIFFLNNRSHCYRKPCNVFSPMWYFSIWPRPQFFSAHCHTQKNIL